MESMIAGKVPWASDGDAGHGADDAYYELAAAIVHQAVKDYTKLIRKMWNPKLSVLQKRNLVLEKIKLEDFFHSSWYESLTDINPDRLMAQCRILAKEQEKKAIESKNKRVIKKMLEEQKKQNQPEKQNEEKQNENEGEE